MAEDFQNNNSTPTNYEDLTRKLKELEQKLSEAEQGRLEEKQGRLEAERKLDERNAAFPKHYLYFVKREEAIDADHRRIVNIYADRGMRIQRDATAANFIDALWRGFETAGSRAFNALCVPSGTGKTQLAFSLPRERCACIYFNMSVEAEQDSTRQPIYDAFKGYMNRLIPWLRQDCATPLNSQLRIYGFLQALIKLLARHPELNLPADLSRLAISEIPVPDDSEEIDFSSEERVRLAIHEWSCQNPNIKRRLVFFIDEFSSKGDLTQEHLAFLRRKFMNVGACLIVASTDSGALNMFNSAAATNSSRGQDAPWVYLVTQLPRYVPSSQLRDAVDRCMNPAIQTILNLCLGSRPLFAATVADIIYAFLSEKNSVEGLGELVEKMRDALCEVMQNKRAAYSPEGGFGYLVAMLLSGGALISGDETQTELFGNLSTKNWAYLVNNADLLNVIETPQIIDESKRQRLESLQSANSADRFMRMSCTHETPTLLCLFREPGNLEGKDVLQFVQPRDNQRHPFPCITFFPDPTEDFLFHLVLAGSLKTPGLRVYDRTNTLIRISVAKLAQSALKNRSSLPASRNAFVPSFADHEAIVCAAFYTACNAGSITGCSLEELIARFVAELMIPRNGALYQELTVVGPIQWNGKFHAPFLFPYDTELPLEVYKVLQTAQASRPANAEKVDAVVYVPDGSGKRIYNVLVEAKSTTHPKYVRDQTRTALKNQYSNAKISFIVVDKSPDKDIRFDPEIFQALNRNKKDGKQWQKDENLNARIFSVYVNGSYKVVLKPIDGKTSEDSLADRLIFVINLEELNNISNA